MGAREIIAKRAKWVALAAPDAEVPSPCNSVCRMDAVTEWCEGCFRTLDEIAAWGRMGEDDKRKVWSLLAVRAGSSS